MGSVRFRPILDTRILEFLSSVLPLGLRQETSPLFILRSLLCSNLFFDDTPLERFLRVKCIP